MFLALSEMVITLIVMAFVMNVLLLIAKNVILIINVLFVVVHKISYKMALVQIIVVMDLSLTMKEFVYHVLKTARPVHLLSQTVSLLLLACFVLMLTHY